MAEHETRVFISYSRRDLAAAENLRRRLIDEGLKAFLDTHDIVPGEEWKARLRELVAQADVVVFLISPDSVRSEYCDWEVNEAERLGKRVCPAVIRATPSDVVPPRLGRLQFTFLETPEKDAAEFPRLLDAIRQDAVWVREHSRLGDLALRWDRAGRPSRQFLRGADISAAELFLCGGPPVDGSASFLFVDDPVVLLPNPIERCFLGRGFCSCKEQGDLFHCCGIQRFIGF